MDVVWIQFSLNFLAEGMEQCDVYICRRNILLILYSDEIDEQIEYVIITREIYRLCGISSGGFCTGVSYCKYIKFIISTW